MGWLLAQPDGPEHRPIYSTSDLSMTFTSSTLISQDLREHILHMRQEMTRLNQKPLHVRQRLSQRVNELLNQSPIVVAEMGFRRREKGSGPNEQSTVVRHRSPNDWELREFLIEPLVAIGLHGQQQPVHLPEPDNELERLRGALARANERAEGLERERDQARAELAALKSVGLEEPEVVATLEIGDYQDEKSVYASLTKTVGIDTVCADDRLMLVAQYERNLAALFSGRNPIAVISHPRNDVDPDEGPFMEAHHWLRLRKLPGGTQLYTAPPISLNLLHLVEAGNALSNTAYALSQKPGDTLTEYGCALLTEQRANWDALVKASVQPNQPAEG